MTIDRAINLMKIEKLCIERANQCDGDVVVGMLHSRDLDYIYGTVEPPEIPSIETYKFPWDEGDITVFDDPHEFVATLKEYYESLPDLEAVRG